MARRTGRPGRTVAVFFITLAVLFGLVALGGTWKPALGLDLEGGTRIQLQAKGSVDPSQLAEARKIIDSRVNGSGVSEAEVTTQGNQFVVVEIPGQNRSDLVDTVTRQAQLRFRLVACSSSDGRCSTQSGLGGTTGGNGPVITPPSGAATGGATGGTQGGTGKTSGSKGGKAGGSGSGNNRPAPAFAVKPLTADSSSSPSASPSSSPAASATPLAGSSASASSAPSGSAAASPSAGASSSAPAQVSPQEQKAIDQCVTDAKSDPLMKTPLKWIDNPTTSCVTAFNTFTCPQTRGPVTVTPDDPDGPLITCDDQGQAYLLSGAMIEGTSLTSAEAVIPQQSVNYVVSLAFDGTGTKQFTEISRALYGTDKQFAAVLDGTPITVATMDAVITNGQAQIQGSFSPTEAKNIATSLKYGALPVAFEQPVVETVGPSLAGDQLSAGIVAGIAGLLLVMLYCLLYYRGLGIVVVSSLLVAGAITYALVLLLDKAAGFTLTLPGIAGLIVAVGITADSFIVYFERIRDEMRDGKSMRVAVEAGWVRARNTCLAADAVSLLAAVVLYIFAAGVVKGFAFALGLSTLIDLAVFFWFTKPMVTYLATFRFFNRGHKLSGLDPEALGVGRSPARGGRTAGGRA